MYLAFKEVLYSKTRYVLIIIVVLLSTYLTLFLSGLAYGLAQDNRSGIDGLRADGLVLSSKASNEISRSQISRQQLADIQVDELAILSTTFAAVELDNGETIDSNIFGIEDGSFILPQVSEGRIFSSAQEIVVDKTLQTVYSYELQDKITFENIEGEYKIVGFVDGAQFMISPIVYMNQTDFLNFRPVIEATVLDNVNSEEDYFNAVAYRGNIAINMDNNNEELIAVSIKEIVNNIPGYREQVLTFTLMIVSLIGIVSFVLSIFMYVLTIQKNAMYGIMKAQGIKGRVILISVLSQTIILTFFGVAFGSILLGLTVLFLPSIVFFQLSYPIVGVILVAFFVFSIIGTLFSIRSIMKLDPLIAMGG